MAAAVSDKTRFPKRKPGYYVGSTIIYNDISSLANYGIAERSWNQQKSPLSG